MKKAYQVSIVIFLTICVMSITIIGTAILLSKKVDTSNNSIDKRISDLEQKISHSIGFSYNWDTECTAGFNTLSGITLSSGHTYIIKNESDIISFSNIWIILKDKNVEMVYEPSVISGEDIEITPSSDGDAIKIYTSGSGKLNLTIYEKGSVYADTQELKNRPNAFSGIQTLLAVNVIPNLTLNGFTYNAEASEVNERVNSFINMKGLVCGRKYRIITDGPTETIGLRSSTSDVWSDVICYPTDMNNGFYYADITMSLKDYWLTISSSINSFHRCAIYDITDLNEQAISGLCSIYNQAYLFMPDSGER